MVKQVLMVVGVGLALAVGPALAMELVSQKGGHHGGGHGGRGGHGGNHGGGHHGGHGGGYGGGGSVSAPSAPSGGTSSDAGAYSAPSATGQGKEREQVHIDARSCDPFGDITVVSKQDGSFTYGGLEFHLPTFVQCMKEKGYRLDTAGRNELTNFGTR